MSLKRQRTRLYSHVTNLANASYGYVRSNPGSVARAARNIQRAYRAYKVRGGAPSTQGSAVSRWSGRTAARAPHAPGGRGAALGLGVRSLRFRRKMNQVRGFRGVPVINETHLDTHVSINMNLRAHLTAVGQSDASSYHHFYVPIEVSDLEPFLLEGLEVMSPISGNRIRKPLDGYVRGYPCNQLLKYYNNYVVKGAEIKADIRLIERAPGGAAAAAATSGWNQTGAVTVPVNFTLMRVSPEEIDYILNKMPELLKGGVNDGAEYNDLQLSHFDRVMREQFGASVVTLNSDHLNGAVKTTWNAAVANATDAASIMEGISDHYKLSGDNSREVTSKYLGVTGDTSAGSGTKPTTITHRPSTRQYVLLVGWFNASSMGEYFLGRPNDREIGVCMDMHVRQQVAFGDGVTIEAGISSGESIISREAAPELPPDNRPQVSTLPPYRPGPVPIPFPQPAVVAEPEPMEAPKLKRSKKVIESEPITT